MQRLPAYVAGLFNYWGWNIFTLQHPTMSVSANKLSLIGCFFALVLSCWLQQTLPVQAAALTPPKTCQLGIYLTSLQNFSPADKSFTANFWVWSLCPFDNLKPLESLKVVNGEEVSKNYDTFTRSENLSDTFKANKNLFWSEQEFSTTIYYNWDTRSYPFDRHVLQIFLEETKLDAANFVYSPDFANSGYQNDMDLEGWKLTDFKIAQINFPYRTSFGNPSIQEKLNHRSRLVISITINRESKVSFFKLAAGVYAAVSLSIMALLLDEDFGDRLGILWVLCLPYW